ncbi:hypothetical protein Leryth_017827, partial [Lithospermum erythrorhizon]
VEIVGVERNNGLQKGRGQNILEQPPDDPLQYHFGEDNPLLTEQPLEDSESSFCLCPVASLPVSICL